MKLFITLAILVLLPISFTVNAEDYDPEYWKWALPDADTTYQDTPYQNLIRVYSKPGFYVRIADRLTFTVKCDTVCDTSYYAIRGAYDYCIYCTTTCDTTWQKKLPVYLDSAQHKRLLELLKPEEPGYWWDNCDSFPDTIIDSALINRICKPKVNPIHVN